MVVIENVLIPNPLKFSSLEEEERSQGKEGQKFNTEKEMFLEELENIKKTLENSYYTST